MPKATGSNGLLTIIEDCYIKVFNLYIFMYILPEISDTKKANYNDEPIIGRSFPIKTYSHSDNRTISWTAHFVVTEEADIEYNMDTLRLLESLVYPRSGGGGSPYRPPPLVKLKCGTLLGRNEELCAVLENYSVKFPTEVAWADRSASGERYVPYKFDVDMTFSIVYQSDDLPGQDRIMDFGR